LFNLLFSIMGAMQSFLFQFLAPAPAGGPNYATYTLGLHMYETGFRDGHMGYASAMAWLLFVMVFGLVAVNYKLSGRWSSIGPEG
jgi:multiple sugar transport system permease protein